jgi:hypothetical protein
MCSVQGEKRPRLQLIPFHTIEILLLKGWMIGSSMSKGDRF